MAEDKKLKIPYFTFDFIQRIERVVKLVESFKIDGDGVHFHKSDKSMGATIRQAVRGSSSGEKLGIITTAVAQDGFTNARWTYSIAPAQFNNDDEAEAIDGEDEITAINLLEFDHIAEPAAETQWLVWGVDAHQDGLSMTPTSVPVNAVVYYRRWTKPDGSLLYTIDRMGGYANLECEA